MDSSTFRNPAADRGYTHPVKAVSIGLRVLCPRLLICRPAASETGSSAGGR